MPNTGLPLPFVSYGLSSIIAIYIGMGIVLNIGLQPIMNRVQYYSVYHRNNRID